MTTLLVCSGGGHLKQLWELAPRLGIDDEVLWVTYDTGLSRSLLGNERVQLVPYVASRDLLMSARLTATAERIFRERRVDRVVSTGAALAAPFMAVARAHRITCHYIESAARSDGPSVTGRIVSRLYGVNLYSQYESWAGGRWHYAGSVFDRYRPGGAVGHLSRLRRVVVTLGTTESYGFRRVVTALTKVLPADASVLWQTGSTDVTGLGIAAREWVSNGELKEAIAESDLVVAHSGTGSALAAMDLGKCPVLVPRLHKFHEHVDDHQVQIARELSRLGLAVMSQVEDLSCDVFRCAMSRRVEVVEDPPAFHLLRDPPALQRAVV